MLQLGSRLNAKKTFHVPSITLLLLSLLFGCVEEAADLSNPKEYNSNQIFFEYPKLGNFCRYITTAIHNLFVETQGEAMVIYQSYPSDMADDLNTFSRTFSESTQMETPIGEISQSELKTIPEEAGFEGIEETFEIFHIWRLSPS